MLLELPARAVCGLAAALALASAALVAAPDDAQAHAAFAGSSPAPGQRVEVAPLRIVLRFTEPLNRSLSNAELERADGANVPVRTVRGARRDIVLVPRQALNRGAYRVEWHSVSTEDSHPLDGSFGFGVRTEAVGGSELEQRPFAGLGSVRALGRWALYAALLLFTGALIAAGFLGRDWVAGRMDGVNPSRSADPTRKAGVNPSRSTDPVARRGRGLLVDAGWLAAGVAALAAVADAADAAEGLGPDGLGDFLTGSFSGLARVGVVASCLVALWLARTGRTRVSALAGAYGLACLAGSGHANSADPRALALAVDWLHLCAGAVWIGAPAFALIVWMPALRAEGAGARARLRRDVLAPFGRLALPAFVLVVASGTASLLIEVGEIRELVETSYGVSLTVKVAIVGVIAALSYVHAVRRSDEMTAWRALRAESFLGVAVVAAAALLAVFPLPPRQLEGVSAALEVVPTCDPCPLPSPAADELPVAGGAGTRVVAGYVRRRGGLLSGSIRVLDRNGRPADGPIDLVGGSTSGCGRGCARFRLAGTPSELHVAIRESGQRHVAVLPARWRQDANAQARALLERAERTMRGLRSLREFERVSSGPGTEAITRYRLRAPDRYAFRTQRGVEAIAIGDDLYQRASGDPWRVTRNPEGTFRLPAWFRWTPYARAVRLLAVRDGVAEVALADPATPVWSRLEIELSTGRVLRERLTARVRFVFHRFFAFNQPVTIEPPPEAAVIG